jgi:hypothetical protein
MTTNQRQVWASLPMYLTREEMLKPFSFIQEFFTREMDLEYARKHLKIMISSAISEDCLLSKKQMVTLFSFKEYLVKLVEACYVIYTDHPEEYHCVIIDTENEEEIMNSKYYFNQGTISCTEWHCFPRYLTVKEFKNPYRVFKKIYTNKTLPEWRDFIDELFNYSISESNVSTDTNSKMWKLFEYLFKLIEAAHLIKVRTKFASLQSCK